jgi:hypothetical protein
MYCSNMPAASARDGGITRPISAALDGLSAEGQSPGPRRRKTTRGRRRDAAAIREKVGALCVFPFHSDIALPFRHA